jgi:hypothetical protein
MDRDVTDGGTALGSAGVMAVEAFKIDFGGAIDFRDLVRADADGGRA